MHDIASRRHIICVLRETAASQRDLRHLNRAHSIYFEQHSNERTGVAKRRSKPQTFLFDVNIFGELYRLRALTCERRRREYVTLDVVTYVF